MMVAVAFLALALAVIVQTIRLNQALVREQQLRAEAERDRARAMLAREEALAAQAEYRRALEQRNALPTAPKSESVKH
jgi:hypothetical protein